MSLLVALGPVLALVAGVEALTGVLSGPRSDPIDIDCPAPLMKGVERPPLLSPLVQAVQRDAYLDQARPSGSADPRRKLQASPPDADSALRSDPLYAAITGSAPDQGPAALMAARDAASGPPQPPPAYRHVLLLSGGGAWGAFGAGFLDQEAAAGTLPPFDAITGVSTGAVLGLLLAAGSAAEARAEYERDAPVGRTRGRGFAAIRSLMRRGGLTDLSPLIARLETWLQTPAPDGHDRMAQLARIRPVLLVGAVDMASGAFTIFDLSLLARNAGAADADRAAAAHAIAGIVAASSAIPMQMVPVRLRDPETGRVRSLVDGGVRLSVFDAHVGTVLARADADRALKASAAGATPPPPTALHVIRNGPTIARPSPSDTARPGQSIIDSQPHLLNILERSQSVLINQNEISSITMLRLLRPETPIFVATADGYTQANPPCTSLPSRTEPFPLDGMRCLARHGAAKAASGNGWISLPTLGQINQLHN